MDDFAHKRRHIRAEPDREDYIEIDRSPNTGAFVLGAVGLLVEESAMSGFGMVCLKSIGLTVGSVRRFKVGRLAPLQAEVMWERVLDDKVARYGLRFLE